MALIFDVKKFAVHDGPGIRTSFFLMGCPLRCKWCQNPEGLEAVNFISYKPFKCTACGACRDVCAHIGDDFLIDKEKCTNCGRCISACVFGARACAAKEYTPREVLAEALKDRIFFQNSNGGVTFSGGECMSSADFLAETLPLLKDHAIHTVIDTCGYADFSEFEKIMDFTDLFLYDIKKMDDLLHQEYTGVSNLLILENARRLVDHGKKIVIRIPLIPGYTDSRSDLMAIGDFILNDLGNQIVRAELLPFNKLAATKYENNTIYRNWNTENYPLAESEPQSGEYVAELTDLLHSRGINVFAEVL